MYQWNLREPSDNLRLKLYDPSLTVVVGVGATDGGRVLARLPRRGEAVITEAGGRGVHREPGECLEIEPQLAHI